MSSKAAIRYAKAIIQQATEENAVNEVFNDMQAVSATLTGSKELRLVLKSPVIKAEDKKEALLKIFVNESAITKGLISVLVGCCRLIAMGLIAVGLVGWLMIYGAVWVGVQQVGRIPW